MHQVDVYSKILKANEKKLICLQRKAGIHNSTKMNKKTVKVHLMQSQPPLHLVHWILSQPIYHQRLTGYIKMKKQIYRVYFITLLSLYKKWWKTWRSPNLDNIIWSIYEGSNVCVINGSYDPHSSYTTFYWIIDGIGHVGRFTRYDQVYGNKRFVDPYQAELYGIYCILLLLKYLCEGHNIKNRKSIVVCNCKGALQCTFEWTKQLNLGANHFDILWSIYQIRTSLPIETIPSHVYSHQDNTSRPLTRHKQLNFKADFSLPEL